MKPLNEEELKNSNGFFLLQEKCGCETPLKRVIDVNEKDSICVIETVLQDYGVNRNRRRYSKELLNRAINTEIVQEKIRTRNFAGEGNHPFSKDISRQMDVDKLRITHIVTKIDTTTDPKYVTGLVETAATTSGKDMYNLIVKNKMQACFSMRGLGKLQTDSLGISTVLEPFLLVSYDWINFPSHPSAYMKTATVKIAESFNPLESNETYSGISKISESEILSFVNECSNTYKKCVDLFDVGDCSAFVESNNSIILEKDLFRLKVIVEEKVSNQISKVFSKLGR